MKRQMLVPMVILMAGLLVAADNSNFSGNWVLNADKSEMDGGNRRGRRFAAQKISITQSADLITISRTYRGRDNEERTTEEKISLDGKESKNETRMGVKSSVAKWDKDGKVLIINSEMTVKRGRRSFNLTVSEKWSLQEKDSELHIELKMTTPRGDRTRRLVYSKQ